MNSIKFCFSFRGRISRRAFRIYLLSLIGFLVLCFILVSIDYALKPIMLTVSIVAYYTIIPVGAKRLHDLNHAGWIILVSIIPCIVGAALDSILGNIVMFTGMMFVGPYLFFAEGNTGANKYGASPTALGEYTSDIAACDDALRLDPAMSLHI